MDGGGGLADRVAAAALLIVGLLLPAALLAQESPPRAGVSDEAVTKGLERLEQRIEELEKRNAELESAADEKATSAQDVEELERRVEELEIDKVAHEDATRTIIRQTFDSWGAKINEFVTLGGTFELAAGWNTDFQGVSETFIRLNTAELDFEIQVNPWTLGSIVIEYADGGDTLFPTSRGDFAVVDRLNIDTAFLSIGDPQRFWLEGRFGRMIMPFGISTGDPVADVLTLEDPLTVEAFETKSDAILIGAEFPTPPLGPLPPAVRPPPVRPKVLNPLFKKMARGLGYKPTPTRPQPPTPMVPPPDPPPFFAGIYFFDSEVDKGVRQPLQHLGGTLGYVKKGHCAERLCPWSIDLNFDYNTSVFDSRFLSFAYEPFLEDIGAVPGIAAHIQGTVGPLGITLEYNGAINDAKFTVESTGERVVIRPRAWQISLGYQFDFNPWVQAIGAQGTYVAFGYSESRGLAGVAQVVDVDGVPTEIRIGDLPRRRYLVSVGEWVLDGLRFAVEYAHIEDYPRSEGGTGEHADGVFTMLTYEW
jgi:hypothetical protein